MDEKPMLYLNTISILPKEFFLNPDVVEVSRLLLGKILVSQVDGKVTAGRIVETEAYDGTIDRACHAFPNKITKRTEVMFAEGGRSYIYLCYGIHHLVNVVTGPEHSPKAVLIRALEPVEGLDFMRERRGPVVDRLLTNGPGKLAEALGVKLLHNDKELYHNNGIIFIAEEANNKKVNITVSNRIGVAYAKEDAFLPWRFYISKNPYISQN
ncbi:putative 3-methyladenine DNA glycosylase [Echinicola pacifica]|uniref:Putative 3-methyladenine DNA glycosylase n=2 Tax=Echinicola pacifica TaxID=346377 RepID=A0A918Q5R5_9BACT|nr:putative 3-methyladenine DNA glycosylase [Echinicola pacifica]